jgi:hypothetical protein
VSAARLLQNNTKLQIEDIWQSTCLNPAQQRTAANTTTRRSCLCHTAVGRQLLGTAQAAMLTFWGVEVGLIRCPSNTNLRVQWQTSSHGHAGHAVLMLNQIKRLINTVLFTKLRMMPEHTAQQSAHAGILIVLL